MVRLRGEGSRIGVLWRFPGLSSRLASVMSSRSRQLQLRASYVPLSTFHTGGTRTLAYQRGGMGRAQGFEALLGYH